MFDVTAQFVNDYRSRGFAVLPSVLGAEELGCLAETADALLAETQEDRAKDGLHDINQGSDRQFLSLRHEDFPDLSDFVLGEPMGGLAAALLGTDPFLFVEQFVVKGPITGASFGWHQDSGYVGFPHTPYLTFWIAIDDATLQNGCIHVLPRDLGEDVSIADHVWDETNKEFVGYAGDDPGVAVEVPAGSIVAFSSVTMHRSLGNTTDRKRRAYLCQYSAEPIIDPKTGLPKHFAKPLVTSRPGTRFVFGDPRLRRSSGP